MSKFFPPRNETKEMTILSILIGHKHMYGLEMVKKSDGKLKRGTIYVTLDRMEDKGLVTSWYEDAKKGQKGPPRRLFRATGEGVRSFKAWQNYMAEMRNPAPKLAWG